MPRRVKGPDGAIHNFPDDATDAEISAALEGTPKGDTYKGPDTYADGFWQSISDTAKGVGRGVVQGLTELPGDVWNSAKAGTGLVLGAAGMPIPQGIPTPEETLAPVAQAIQHPVQAARAAAMAASDPQQGGAMATKLAAGLIAGRVIPKIPDAVNAVTDNRQAIGAAVQKTGKVMQHPIRTPGKLVEQAGKLIKGKPVVAPEVPPPVASATYAPPVEAPTAPQGTMAPPGPGYTYVPETGGYVAPEAPAAGAVEQAVEGRGVAPAPAPMPNPMDQIYQSTRDKLASQMTPASPAEFLRSVRKVAMDAGVGLTADEQAAVTKWGNTVTPTEAVERIVAARKLQSSGSFANLPTSADVDKLKTFPKGMRGKATPG